MFGVKSTMNITYHHGPEIREALDQMRCSELGECANSIGNKKMHLPLF